MRRLVAGLVLASLTLTGIAAPASAAAPLPNIVQKLVQMNQGTGQFETLLILAACPGFGGQLLDDLDGPEVLTLFAPTDAAFAETGLNELEAALFCLTADADDLSLIAYILGYHVTLGPVRYRDLQRGIGSTLPMGNGEGADITGTRSRPLIDGAAIIRKDQKASNGLIQVVDAMLTPYCLPLGAGSIGTNEAADC